MQLEFPTKPSKNALLIYPLCEKAPVGKASLKRLLAKLATSKEFRAKSGQVFFVYPAGISGLPEKIIFLGLGDKKDLSVSSVMSAFGVAIKSAASHGPQTVSVHLSPELAPYAQSVSEAICLGSYQAAAPYKTGKALEKLASNRVEHLEFFGPAVADTTRAACKKGLALGQTANHIRDAVNAPPNFAHAEFFKKMSHEIAKASGAKLTILKKKELEKLRMGALLGVNRGSPDEAFITILDYQPKGADGKKPPIVLVGKGILFDSGGYNLKPRGSLEDMQLDKAGAVVVLSLIKLLPLLGISRRIIAVAPFTENLIGSRALKPSEILTTYSGKTIEITNTDGEGRLILSDAIAYAIDTYKPQLLLDLATLTGACMVALGERYAGLFGNDDELQKKLRAAGDEVDELLWPLPIHKDDADKMKGHYADLRNADLGSERYAGASKGAAFIQEFVGKTPWAHLDIAGPAFVSDPKKYDHKGATGFGLRLLARFLENLGR